MQQPQSTSANDLSLSPSHSPDEPHASRARTAGAGPPPWRAWLIPSTLLAMTILTTTFAGAWSWAGVGADPGEFWRQPSLLLRGLPYSLALLAILLAHELGHYFACRRYRIAASLPYFVPGPPLVGTFGALIRIRGPIPNRNALFDVAAAGPIAGFLVAVPFLVLGVWLARPLSDPIPDDALQFGSPLLSQLLERWLHGTADIQVGSFYGAAWVGMLVTSLNLFPVGQLDGGHAACAVSRRLHRWLAWTTIAALFALITGQILILHCVPAYALWAVVLLVLRDRHPRLVDEHTPLSPLRKRVALLLALLFVLTFIPLPIRIPFDWL